MPVLRELGGQLFQPLERLLPTAGVGQRKGLDPLQPLAIRLCKLAGSVTEHGNGFELQTGKLSPVLGLKVSFGL